MGGDHALEATIVGKGAEPGEGVGVQRLAVALDGIAREINEVICALTSGDRVVVVAGEGDRRSAADERERLLRERAVAFRRFMRRAITGR